MKLMSVDLYDRFLHVTENDGSKRKIFLIGDQYIKGFWNFIISDGSPIDDFTYFKVNKLYKEYKNGS